MSRLFDKRLILVGGKGGTGKSTVSAALATAAAREGKRVLVVELNTRAHLAALYGVADTGGQPTPLREGIEVVNLIPAECLREVGLMKLKFERLYRAVFDNEPMQRLVRMVPGLNELLMLGKLMEMERERRGDAPRWDLLVVDAPATGHGTALLRLPQAILGAVPTGPLADDVRRIHDLLRDPLRTAFNIVTVPEDMAVREAIELHHQISQVVSLPLGYLFVNAVWPDGLSPGDRRVFSRFSTALGTGDPELSHLLTALAHSASRHEHEAPQLLRVRQQIRLPQVEIPFVFAATFGPAAIDQVSDHVARELSRHELGR